MYMSSTTCYASNPTAQSSFWGDYRRNSLGVQDPVGSRSFNSLRVTPQLNCPIEFLRELSSRFTGCAGSSWFKVLQVASTSGTSALLTRSGSLIELRVVGVENVILGQGARSDGPAGLDPGSIFTNLLVHSMYSMHNLRAWLEGRNRGSRVKVEFNQFNLGFNSNRDFVARNDDPAGLDPGCSPSCLEARPYTTCLWTEICLPGSRPSMIFNSTSVGLLYMEVQVCVHGSVYLDGFKFNHGPLDDGTSHTSTSMDVASVQLNCGSTFNLKVHVVLRREFTPNQDKPADSTRLVSLARPIRTQPTPVQKINPASSLSSNSHPNPVRAQRLKLSPSNSGEVRLELSRCVGSNRS
ncbi:hypothetical protein C8R46DRAFT_1041927 [Mycena filopes]|nr:hypothetical protein C8R46DRAFT_1041927 [Mycena filopes]